MPEIARGARRLPNSEPAAEQEDMASTADLANLSGYTSTHLYDLARRAIIPTPTKGQWPVIRTVQALFKHLKDEVAAKHTGKLAEARIKVEEARAKIYEDKVAVGRDEVVNAEETKARWEGLMVSFRTKILAIPSRLAPMVVHQRSVPEAEALLVKALRDALEELAKKEDDDD